MGAIAWARDGAAVVQRSSGQITDEAITLARHAHARKLARAARKAYVPTDDEWAKLRVRFDDATNTLDSVRLRLLVRNLLRGLGVSAQSGVRGDTSDRTEAAFAHQRVIGLVEIGRETNLLEDVRRVMTAVAVAHARRGIELDRLVPVIFVTAMPNQRTDGYELLRDLASVLGLEVAIVPVAALQLAVVASRQSGFMRLLSAGRKVDSKAAALDVGPAVTSALGLPLAATAGTAAFSPRK